MIYKNITQDLYCSELVSIANKIIRNYESNINYNYDVEIFLKKFIDVVLMHGKYTITNLKQEERLKLFKKSQSEDFINEFEAVIDRVERFKKGRSISTFGNKHSLYVVNFCMMALSKHYNQPYTHYFKQETDAELKKRIHRFDKIKQINNTYFNIFYHNAFRAEKYFYEGDFYINMIVTRMAVEQFINFLYDFFKIKSNLTLSPKVNKVVQDKLAPDHLSTEMLVAVKRGNNNTHQGYSGYYFSAKHNLDLLVEMQELMINLYKNKRIP